MQRHRCLNSVLIRWWTWCRLTEINSTLMLMTYNKSPNPLWWTWANKLPNSRVIAHFLPSSSFKYSRKALVNSLESLSPITLKIIAEICSTHYRISDQKRRRVHGHPMMALLRQKNKLKVYPCQQQQPKAKSSHHGPPSRLKSLRHNHQQNSCLRRQRPWIHQKLPQEQIAVQVDKRRRKRILLPSKERKMRNSTRWSLYKSDRPFDNSSGSWTQSERKERLSSISLKQLLRTCLSLREASDNMDLLSPSESNSMGHRLVSSL